MRFYKKRGEGRESASASCAVNLSPPSFVFWSYIPNAAQVAVAKIHQCFVRSPGRRQNGDCYG